MIIIEVFFTFFKVWEMGKPISEACTFITGNTTHPILITPLR
jgi:hypothetical protein